MVQKYANLRIFMTTKSLSARQARWAEEPSAYYFIIEHVKEKENVIADALSRRPDFKKTEEEPTRTTRIFKEVNGNLEVNKNIQLEKEIKENSTNPDFDQISKWTPRTNLDTKAIRRVHNEQIPRRFHRDIREGHQVKQGRWKKSKETITSQEW